MVLWNLYFSEHTFGNADGIPYLINKDTESQKGERILSRCQGHLGGSGGTQWWMTAFPDQCPVD